MTQDRLLNDDRAMNRNVFKYYNGVEVVFADPLRTWGIILIKLEGKVAEVCTHARNKDDTVSVAQQQLAAMRLDDAVCAAFEMPPFDPKTGQGSTLLDRLRVWGEFSSYMDEKKNRPEPSATLSAPSAPEVESIYREMVQAAETGESISASC